MPRRECNTVMMQACSDAVIERALVSRGRGRWLSQQGGMLEGTFLGAQLPTKLQLANLRPISSVTPDALQTQNAVM